MNPYVAASSADRRTPSMHAYRPQYSHAKIHQGYDGGHQFHRHVAPPPPGYLAHGAAPGHYGWSRNVLVAPAQPARIPRCPKPIGVEDDEGSMASDRRWQSPTSFMNAQPSQSYPQGAVQAQQPGSRGRKEGLSPYGVDSTGKTTASSAGFCPDSSGVNHPMSASPKVYCHHPSHFMQHNTNSTVRPADHPRSPQQNHQHQQQQFISPSHGLAAAPAAAPLNQPHHHQQQQQHTNVQPHQQQMLVQRSPYVLDLQPTYHGQSPQGSSHPQQQQQLFGQYHPYQQQQQQQTQHVPPPPPPPPPPSLPQHQQQQMSNPLTGYAPSFSAPPSRTGTPYSTAAAPSDASSHHSSHHFPRSPYAWQPHGSRHLMPSVQ